VRIPLVVQITSFLAVLVLVVSASTWFVLSSQENRVIEREQRRTAEMLVSSIDHGVSAAMMGRDKDVARKMVDDLVTIAPISRVVIYDNRGAPWHDTAPQDEEFLAPAAEIAAIARSGTDEFRGASRQGESVYVALSPIPAAEACFACHAPSPNLGVVGVVLSAGPTRAAFERDRRTLVALSTAAGAATTAVLGLVLTYLVVRRIRKLSLTAREITDGDLTVRSDVSGDDEIGDLARAFNTMTGRLERQIVDLESTRADLQQRIERIGQAINSAHRIEELSDVLAREAATLGRADAAAILLFSPQEELMVVGARGLDAKDVTRYNARPLKRDDPAIADTGRARFAILPGKSVHDAVPIAFEGKVLGFIGLARNRTSALTDDAKQLLSALASQAGLAVEQIRLNEQAKVMAITDGLTGLYSHRYFQERLASEFERARRFDHPISVAMIDIDHFKQFNDRFGHQAGDLLLERLGEIMRASVRRVDTAARYGGDEFAVMLVETDIAEAVAFAERLRAAVAAARLAPSAAREGVVTVSIGVATGSAKDASPKMLVAKADQALYQAKAAGRNRVQAAGDGAGFAQALEG
jgi:diguanylate cyclase (GGDEF)-like protein